jgi:hypothetical protein
MNEWITPLLSFLGAVITAALLSIPGWRAAKNQRQKDEADSQKTLAEKENIEDQITERVLARADLYMEKQEKQHKAELEKLQADHLLAIDGVQNDHKILNKKYNVVIRENASMANDIEELRRENAEQKRVNLLQYEQYQVELRQQRESYEREIAELRDKIDELRKQLEKKTGPLDK